METSQSSIAQRSQEKLYFDHRDMDYYFSWIVGRQLYAGSDMRECLEVASRIVNGDPESWCSAWGRLLARGCRARLQRAHGRSARSRYQSYR